MNNPFRSRRQRLTGCGLLAITLLIMPFSVGAAGFSPALPGYRFAFPHDHGPHAAYQTEWWYYTGRLTANSGRSYGYQLTFFRRGIDADGVRRNPSKWALKNLFLAHFAITDETQGRFYASEKVNRPGIALAGAQEKPFKIWNGSWSAAEEHGTIVLSAVVDGRSILLRLKPAQPPVIHGQDGVSRKGPEKSQTSHYYSLTRLDTSGTMTINGRLETVKGLSWMDHEFGSNQLSEDQVGWDWFGLHLDNGMDLMLYRIRRSDGTVEPASSGTLVLPDGRAIHLPLEAVRYSVQNTWASPQSKAVYPSVWTIALPDQQLELTIRPTIPDQELMTTQSTRVTYWEGSVLIAGKVGEEKVSGSGYMELTGYAQSMGKAF